MKSIADLEAIRQKTLSKVNLRREHEGVRIVVGMATCGIAAGARPVMNAFIDEVGKRNLLNVVVAQTGCIGMCRYEPIVEVMRPRRGKGHIRECEARDGRAHRSRPWSSMASQLSNTP